MISDRTKRNIKNEFSRSFLPKLGISLLLIVIVLATVAPLVAPHDPTQTSPEDANLPPVGMTTDQETTRSVDGEIETVTKTVRGTLEHPLGTDAVGRDMASRVLYGARTSLAVGLISSSLAALLGVTVGLVAGYYGGAVDDSLMRFADIMLAFPALVLAISLIGLLGPTTIVVPDPFVSAGLAEGMPEDFVLPGTVTAVIVLIIWVWFARIARG